jgi:hypothetical protein
MLSELLGPYGLTNGVRGLHLKSDGLACASKNKVSKVKAMNLRAVLGKQAAGVNGAPWGRSHSPKLKTDLPVSVLTKICMFLD